MTFKRHMIAAGLALAVFVILSFTSSTVGIPMLAVMALLGLAMTGLHYRYRRLARHQLVVPVTPYKDNRIIPQHVKQFVTLRDKGKCQIRFPGICLGIGQCFDHKFPHSKGGSSKDPRNIQLACNPCNLKKADKILV